VKSFKIDINVLGLPLLVLGSLILLSFVAGRILIDNITRLQSQISDNQTMENTLNSKLTSLKVLTTPQTGAQLAALELDLPQTNPIFEAMSKIQGIGLGNSLAIGNFNSNTIAQGKDNPISSAEVDFTAQGSYSGISAFITSMKNYFPLTRFDSIKILNQNQTGGNVTFAYKLSGSVFTYWATLPNVLPSIETPVSSLTNDEQSQVTKILSLQIVTLASSASPSGSMGKTNPFQ